MKLADILSGTSSIKLLSESDRFLKSDKFISNDNLNALSCSTTQIDNIERTNLVSRKQSSRTKKEPKKSASFLRNLTRTKNTKVQVMLSYARSDMSAYVKPLKEELTKLGLSVYLVSCHHILLSSIIKL